MQKITTVTWYHCIMAFSKNTLHLKWKGKKKKKRKKNKKIRSISFQYSSLQNDTPEFLLLLKITLRSAGLQLSRVFIPLLVITHYKQHAIRKLNNSCSVNWCGHSARVYQNDSSEWYLFLLLCTSYFTDLVNSDFTVRPEHRLIRTSCTGI